MKETVTIIAIVAILFVFMGWLSKAREAQIKDKVASVGGEFIECELRLFNHPFWLVGKGEQVYRFTYRITGQVKEGWVKFSLFDDWKL